MKGNDAKKAERNVSIAPHTCTAKKHAETTEKRERDKRKGKEREKHNETHTHTLSLLQSTAAYNTQYINYSINSTIGIGCLCN